MNNESQQCDIAIVGGGMVGLALACSLASRPLTKHLNVATIDSNLALGRKHFIQKEDLPDPRVSMVTPATVSFFKDIGAWQQHRHAYFDMQVWDHKIQCKQRSTQDTDLQKKLHPSRLTSMSILPNSSSLEVDSTLSLTSFFTHGRLATLELEDGNSRICKVGGRSRWKQVTRVSRIAVEHAVEDHCAWKRFLPAGPIALLPIGDKFSNIVCTMNPKESSEFKSMSEDDFLEAVNYVLDYGYGLHPASSLLGNADLFSWLKGDISRSATECFEIPPKVVKLASERMAFPLSLRHANDYASKRVVLIGDAAHTVHPLAGQGVNLDFCNASTLSSAIFEGIAIGRDIEEVSLLKKYEANRKTVNVMIMAVLDGFQKAYFVDFGPLNLLQAAAFHHLKRASSLMPLMCFPKPDNHT